MTPLKMSMEVATQVMGTRAQVVVRGPDPGLADVATDRLRDLHRRWSRFEATSEVSALNDGAGAPVVVSHDTLQLVYRAVTAWHRTAGGFDPTVLAALVACGYDRTFEALAHPRCDPAAVAAAPGCAGIVIDVDRSTVALPVGVGFDPGGIGKGLAADIVSYEVLAAGAEGVLVNIGGDLRVRGEGPDAGGWVVAVRERAVSDQVIATVRLTAGAIATSTPCRRRWSTDDGDRHHLIDPRTGHPHADPPVLVSAIAGEAWWAEAVTKAALVQPADRLSSCAVLTRRADGRQSYSGGFEAYCRG